MKANTILSLIALMVLLVAGIAQAQSQQFQMSDFSFTYPHDDRILISDPILAPNLLSDGNMGKLQVLTKVVSCIKMKAPSMMAVFIDGSGYGIQEMIGLLSECPEILGQHNYYVDGNATADILPLKITDADDNAVSGNGSENRYLCTGTILDATVTCNPGSADVFKLEFDPASKRIKFESLKNLLSHLGCGSDYTKESTPNQTLCSFLTAVHKSDMETLVTLFESGEQDLGQSSPCELRQRWSGYFIKIEDKSIEKDRQSATYKVEKYELGKAVGSGTFYFVNKGASGWKIHSIK